MCFFFFLYFFFTPASGKQSCGVHMPTSLMSARGQRLAFSSDYQTGSECPHRLSHSLVGDVYGLLAVEFQDKIFFRGSVVKNVYSLS